MAPAPRAHDYDHLWNRLISLQVYVQRKSCCTQASRKYNTTRVISAKYVAIPPQKKKLQYIIDANK